MTDIYRVTAPYITLKSKDPVGGGDVVLGYFKDSLVPESVDLEDLARHIRKGMVEKVEGAEARAAEKQQADADRAQAAAVVVEDKEGAAAVRKAEADKAAAEQAAAKDEAEAAKAGTPLLKASDSKPGVKTAKAG